MTEAERLAELLEELLAKATPGPWGIWFEQIDGKADRAIQEFVEQVHATNPIGNSLVMLDADGKCPAITGCGPTSIANAALIVEAVNALPVLLSALRSQAEELERLRGALGEARDTFDKMGKAIAETCPATFAQEIAVCKLSCDEISAALRETKAAPEQEQA